MTSVVGGLSIAVWQLIVSLREGDVARLVWVLVAVGLGVGIPAFIYYVRALPRRELKKRIASVTDADLFEGKIDAHGLTQLGQRDVTGVTDVVVGVDAVGVHVYPTNAIDDEILLRASDIVDVAVAGDDDPNGGAGMVALELSRDPHDVSITLYAPFMWGAFPATPSATRRFVATVRDTLDQVSGVP